MPPRFLVLEPHVYAAKGATEQDAVRLFEAVQQLFGCRPVALVLLLCFGERELEPALMNMLQVELPASISPDEILKPENS